MRSRLVAGKPVLYVAAHNITERKQAEEQIKASLREKETLLQEIHHRVKNNLAIISSLLELQSDAIWDEPARAAFQESQNRVRAMARIHEHLYRSQDLARVDMAEYVEGVVDYLSQSYGVYTIALQIDVSDVALDIDTAIPCGLIINELVSNALKHAFPPDWQRPESGQNQVRVALRLDDGQCKLTVSDNGAGLPADLNIKGQESLGLRLVNILSRQLKGVLEMNREGGTTFCLTFAIPEERSYNKEHLTKIFDPYFSTKAKGPDKGTGIGLTICHSIIGRHSGYITVDSELGVGTTFYIYLPASESEVTEDMREEKPVSFGIGRILLMDDEQMIRNVAGEILKHLGYDVAFAEDGAAAIEVYREAKESGKPFDAVILDLTIRGGMGGKEVYEQLHLLDPEVKAIVSSGYSNDPVITNFKQYGFVGAIAKPYNMKEVSEMLRRVV